MGEGGFYDISLGRPAWPNTEIVGSSGYPRAIRAALGRKELSEVPAESEVILVVLVPEPDNPRSPGAISVRWNGLVIGYLGKADARAHAQPIRRITASGPQACTRARIRAVSSGWDGFEARVTVHLPHPGLIAPLNDPPRTPSTLIPWGSAVRVLDLGDHPDILARCMPSVGVGLLLVTLRAPDPRPGAVVEVRVDGQPVGRLGGGGSASCLPLLGRTKAIRRTAVAYAELTRSALGMGLSVHAAKPSGISPERLAAPHAVPALVPSAEGLPGAACLHPAGSTIS